MSMVSERVKGVLLARPEVTVLAAALVGMIVFLPDVPWGIRALGLAGGAGIALHAVGIVLVYRTNRIINFAQVELGALGGAIFLELVRGRLVLKGLRAVCVPCLPGPRTLEDLRGFPNPAVSGLADQPALEGLGNTPIARIPGFTRLLPRGLSLDDLAAQGATGWLVQLNFWIALILSLAVVVLASYCVYVLVVRRFENAPRLIATVVTIGLSQVFVFLAAFMVRRLRGDPTEGAPVALRADAGFPFRLELRIPPATFGTTDIVGVVVAAVVLSGLALFFARSAIGVVLRGAAENKSRAETLGVSVSSVNALVWMMAGGLSGIASILVATGNGISTGGGASLVKYMAAAVVGGLVSIPVAAAAAVALGVIEQSVIWSIKAPGANDAVLLVLIVVALLVQRARGTRVDTEADAGWKAAREARPIPVELRGLEVVRRWVRTGQISVLVVVIGLPWLLSAAQTNLAAITLVYAMIAMSLLVLTGWAGQISLGHFAFAAIGAWVTSATGWPFPIALLASGVVGGVVAVLVGLPALRLRGLHLAISTLAFAVAVTSILLNPQYLGRALPDTLRRPALLGIDLEDQRTFYYFVLAWLLLVLTAVVGLRRHRTARALIACRENEAAAQTFGINLLRVRLSAFAVSGFIASVAGGLYAYSQHGVDPESFGFEQSIKMFLMVVVGGTGSVVGPLVGAAYVGASDIFGQSIPLFSLLATGIGVVTLLLVAPGGLAQVLFGLRDSILRRVADRNHIDVPSLMEDRRSQGRRAGIAPKTRAGGGAAFVPARYRAVHQWSIDRQKREDIDV